jgi:probable rRNA maturation factor
MSRLDLEISNQYKQLASPVEATQQLYRALEASGAFPISAGELSIVFVGDATIGQIHADFMGDPSATDVITFPANAAMDSAGEIIVSVDHALSRALELGEPFSRELSLYLVHGWLHLAGFDDRNAIDRAAMRGAEQQALAILDEAGAGGHFVLTNND